MPVARRTGKLAVILHADVAGSTALVQTNEALAHQRIQEIFQRFGDTIRNYNGIVRELRGDALLAEFARASDATAAALAFQQDQIHYNAQLDDDIRPKVRIGIAMGEVIVADDTITGAGVVLAQRLEQLSKPGGVCIQGAAYETLPRRLPFDFQDLGKQDLKGFEQPVRAYSITLKTGEAVPMPETQYRTSAQRIPIAALVILALAAGGLALWQPWVQETDPSAISRTISSSNEKPTLAVLPFTNLSDDPKQEYFSDGMTDDLITDLSKLSGLFVVARNSSFTYKGRVLKPDQVAEELGVRYVLEGSVRRAGDQIRINAQLIDSSTGGHLWAERYDGALTDVFALQDQVTGRIVEALAVALTPDETRQVSRTTTRNFAAHDAYLLGLSFYHRDTPVDNAKARAHFQEAIKLDPEYSRAFAALAKVYARGRVRSDLRYSEALGVHWRHALPQALTYLEGAKEGADPDVHVVRSWLALRQHQHSRAIAEAELALELKPNDTDALEALAEALIYSGRIEKGMEIARNAMRQNPVLVARPLFLMGLAMFASGEPRKSIELIERSMTVAPERSDFAAVLAAAYGELDMTEKANAAILAFSRGFWRSGMLASLDQTVVWHPFSDRVVLERFAKGLKASGAHGDGFMPLYTENKLTGLEISALLYGANIRGTNWDTFEAWRQQRAESGEVEHSGYPIHTGKKPGPKRGLGRIEDNRLCETWPDAPDAFDTCVVVFRMPQKDSVTTRRGDYVMVTALAPQPFRVVE